MLAAPSSSMSPSSPAGTPDTSLELHDDVPAKRRVSGRARTKPATYSDPPEPKSNGVKRKRNATNFVEADEDIMESESSADEESDPDEEELKEQRRKSRAKPRKPATKKTKTTTLAMRPAANGVKRAARPKKARTQLPNIVGEEETGLFAELFSEGHTLEGVAAEWIARWNQHNSAAMTDLINFVIRCTGCSLSVDIHDIEDPDNAVSKLTDLQDEYAAQQPTDYPMISKVKANSSFRATVTSFFEILIQTCHTSGLLYSDLAIIENIDVWVSTMSSSGMRPFRHTASVISLAIGVQLARVAAELAETTATTTRQKEGEKKQKKVNKERVKQFDTRLAELERKLNQAKDSLSAVFESVYVHRYRDVDPRIRVDCVTAMGNWIVIYPDFFFEGTYLRYLGWVLSDTFPQTRAEDIKQLTRLYKNKDNIARLRTFTERFRSRLVEMAMQDSEVGIRASTVELLTRIREAGLLEPHDIDNVGRLIFDSEPRVRKAVAGFIADNIQDIFDNSIEELGGMSALPESIQEEPPEGEDVEAPRLSWLKLKSVVEAVKEYDAQEKAGATKSHSRRMNLLTTTPSESRYIACAQTICEGVKEAKEWDVIIGYLLYDFSAPNSTFEWRCQLEEQEQILMLEILCVSVKMRLAEASEGEADKKGKKTKAQKNELRQAQENIALHLAKAIPDLFKKFGSNSATTSAILRLGHVLNLEIFQELREDSTTYSALLDDINRQFLTHADSAVLAEATTALLHARSFEDLEEITQGKVQELWDDTTNVVRNSMSHSDWVTNRISAISDALRRITHLASIMDCTAIFQAAARAPATKQRKKNATPTKSSSLFDLLMELLREPALDDTAGPEADDALVNAMKALLTFYMWQVRHLQTTKPALDLDLEAHDFSSFSSALINVAGGRSSSSSVRVAAIGTLLDLHTLFSTFRHKDAPLPGLIRPVDPKADQLILSTFSSLEKSFARKSRKKLEINYDDDLNSAPEDFDDEDDEDSEDEDDSDVDTQAVSAEDKRAQDSLLAEKRLCEITGKIVLALIARVLDQSSQRPSDPQESDADADTDANVHRIRRRISRNRARLGKNFTEVLAYLDRAQQQPNQRKAAARAKAKGKAIAAAAAGPSPSAQRGQKQKQVPQAGKLKSQERVNLLDDEDEDDDDEELGGLDEGGEEDLRARELVEDRIVDDASEDEDEDEDEDDVEAELPQQATAGRSKGKGKGKERALADEIVDGDEDEDEIMGD